MNDDSFDAKAQNLSWLRTSLVSALQDGDFTEQKLQALKRARDALGLSAQTVRTLRPLVYHQAYLQASQRGKTCVPPRKADSLDRLLQFFNAPH
jgi:hypothetical protein